MDFYGLMRKAPEKEMSSEGDERVPWKDALALMPRDAPHATILINVLSTHPVIWQGGTCLACQPKCKDLKQLHESLCAVWTSGRICACSGVLVCEKLHVPDCTGSTCLPCPGLATTIHPLSSLLWQDNMLQFSLDEACVHRSCGLAAGQYYCAEVA